MNEMDAYWEFMRNPNNENCCGACPENIGQAGNSTQGFIGQHECGQQVCMVDLLARLRNRYEEEDY